MGNESKKSHNQRPENKPQKPDGASCLVRSEWAWKISLSRPFFLTFCDSAVSFNSISIKSCKRKVFSPIFLPIVKILITFLATFNEVFACAMEWSTANFPAFNKDSNHSLFSLRFFRHSTLIFLEGENFPFKMPPSDQRLFSPLWLLAYESQ